LKDGNWVSQAEIYSPDGKCQHVLASLPTPVTGLFLVLFNGSAVACSGYSNKVTILVNFINVLRAAFSTIFLRQKNTKLKYKQRKVAQVRKGSSKTLMKFTPIKLKMLQN